MRLVEVLVVEQSAVEPVIEALREEGIDYTISDHSGDAASTSISFPLPANAVEPIIDRFHDLGVYDSIYTVVHDVETVVTERFNQISEGEGEIQPLGRERISRTELRTSVREMLPGYGLYSTLVAIGALSATAGLLLNSLAVVIGSMVIAPMFAPPMATSVAAVTSDRSLLVDGLKLQGLGVGVGAASATMLALLVRFTPFVDASLDLGAIVSMGGLSSSIFLLLLIALASGAAGAIDLSTGTSSVLTEVMVAAAIIPPISLVGIGIAWEAPMLVVGATAATFVYVLASELAGIVALWYLGYHPASWVRLRNTRSTILWLVLVLVALLGALTMFLAKLSDAGWFIVSGLHLGPY